MSKFQKLLDHPEKEKILGKLIGGETPKEVAQYLKLKYHSDDEKHLRLSAAMMDEFVSKYLNHTNFLTKVIQDDKMGQLDKKIADSLINNKTWRERLAEYADTEIDLKKQIKLSAQMIEARLEQLFDKTQENPGSTKLDHVITRYFELWTNALEKADKLINERPDKVIQHDVTITMLEQTSVVFQETIRELLMEMDPSLAARFMEMFHEKMNAVRNNQPMPRALGERVQEINKLTTSVDASLEETADEL